MIIQYRNITLDVEYDYYPGCKGLKDALGGRLTQDEPQTVDLESVKTEHGDNITALIYGALEFEIEQIILENLHEYNP